MRFEIKNKDRFLRTLSRRMKGGCLARLGLGERGFCGRATENGVVLYRGGRGVLTLLGTTLYGRFVKGGEGTALRLRFSRSRPVALVWGLWCALLFAASLSLIFGTALGVGSGSADRIAGLILLALSLLLCLPLFCFSKRERGRLVSFVESALAPPFGASLRSPSERDSVIYGK